MSGSEFERENIVTEALSAAADSKPADTLLEDLRASTAGVRRPRACTTPRSRRIPAASASSPTSRARSRIRSSPTRSAFSATSNIAARSAPIRAPATAPAFWCRFRTPSSRARPPRSASSCRSPANTPSARCSCRRRRRGAKVIKSIIADQIKDEGLVLLGWRDVPTDNSSLGETVKPTEPVPHAGVHRPQRRGEDRGRVRAPALHPAQVDLAGDLSAPRPRPRRLLPGVAVVPHRDLQGHVPRRPARQVLSRPARAGFRKRAGAGASALLDQHLPGLVAGASLPDDRP